MFSLELRLVSYQPTEYISLFLCPQTVNNEHPVDTALSMYSVVQCSVVQRSACSAVLCSAVQNGAVQCSAVHCSEGQLSILQYRTLQGCEVV